MPHLRFRDLLSTAALALCALLPSVLTASWEAPLLWKIEADKPAYLFGTIHLSDARLVRLPAEVEDAFRAADIVYTEVPFDPESLGKAMQATFAPAGEGLAEILPPALHARAAEALKAIRPELDIAAFNGLRIWAFTTQLVLLETQLKNPFAAPLDLRLYRRAQTEGKDTRGLETIDEQLGIFKRLTREEAIQMLRDTLDLLDEARAEGSNPAEELLAVYLSGDLKELGRVMTAMMAGGGDTELNKRLVEEILTDRDKVMAERIIRLLRDEPEKVHFFAIGAGHFASPSGIQHQLRAEGLEVSRVKAASEATAR